MNISPINPVVKTAIKKYLVKYENILFHLTHLLILIQG